MKNAFTLTKTLTLSVLLLVFAGASASNGKTGDDKDTSKCKKHCCRSKETNKEIQASLKEFNEAMKELAVQMKSFDAAKLKIELVQTMSELPVKVIKTTNGFVFSYAPEMENNQEDAKQKIDFSNLEKEMDKVQEGMTQMDPALKKDDAKSRKTADELLKTGIKS
jgi:hypothetical protein